MKEHKREQAKGCRPETEVKYRPARELYVSTNLSMALSVSNMQIN